MIKELLKKNNSLVYFVRTIKRRNDPFVKDIILNDNHYSIYNPDKYGQEVIYYIESGNKVSGFFAEYFRLVDALAYAEMRGLKSYVNYTKDYLYSEEDGFMGTNNPYEYYFLQPFPEIMNINDYGLWRFTESDRQYIKINVEKKKEDRGYYTANEEDKQRYLVRAAKIVEKYIRFNDTTDEYLKENIKNILSEGKIIGVHARGGEWRKPVKGHPIPVTLEENIALVKSLVDEYSYDRIFLASDEEEAIDAFKKTFGKKVVFYEDTFRGKDGTWLARAESDRKHHHYLMGLEVLRDAETLANCNGLVAGLSNVSLYAQLKRKTMAEEFLSLNIIDKGINTYGRQASNI